MKNLPVYPIAIFSYDAPRSPQPNIYQVAFPDKVVLEFNYAVIQLNRLNWRDFLRQQNPVATALMAKMNVALEERPRVKLECLRLLTTLRLNPARMQLISGFIDTYLKLNAAEEELFQAEISQISPVEQEDVMQIVTSWMDQGKQEEALSLIMRLLPRRIGIVEPELQERIRQLSLTQLENLAEALLDFSSSVDLANWLDSQED